MTRAVTASDLRATSLVDGLPATIPFVGPEAIERRKGFTFKARLGANESAFGISPKAREAMRHAVDEVAWYNDPENHDLKQALALHHGVSPDEISVGAGIDDLLGLAVRAFADRGETVAASLGAYPTFIYHVDGFGCRLETVPYRNDRNDLDGLADLANRTGARLVYVSNPDNPAGTWHTSGELAGFLARLPPDCGFILDEAYADFAPADAIPPMTPMDPRVMRMRTFSKAHGMAGARVGYAIASHEVVTTFEKIRLHFAVNRVAQAGALASLGDRDFVAGVVRQVAEGRADYANLGEELGLPTLPSAANFVTFDAGTALRANAILEALTARRVFARKPGKPPLDRCFRVTVGRPEERRHFAEALRELMRMKTLQEDTTWPAT